MSFDKALTDSQKGGIIATKTRLQWCNSRNNDRMPSHNSSTVFCSLIRKISVKTIRSAAHSLNQRDRQNWKPLLLRTKNTTTKIWEITKVISKAKNRRISQEQFTVHFMKKMYRVYSFKKASHLRKKIENSTRVGNGKEGIGLLQTGRKSYGRMNLLFLRCGGTEKTQSSAFKCSQTWEGSKRRV